MLLVEKLKQDYQVTILGAEWRQPVRLINKTTLTLGW